MLDIVFFLLADNRCANNGTAADKQQSKPQHKVAVIAGLRSLRIVRQFSRYGSCLGNFLGSIGVAVILTAALAVPILNIALGILGRRLCVDMLEVGVIVCVKFAVSLSTDVAYRFFGAGGFAAGASVKLPFSSSVTFVSLTITVSIYFSSMVTVCASQ